MGHRVMVCFRKCSYFWSVVVEVLLIFKQQREPQTRNDERNIERKRYKYGTNSLPCLVASKESLTNASSTLKKHRDSYLDLYFSPPYLILK